jgi:acetylornithine deacetylase/succinyl-diaminopimelate desuccinylase-like protein
MIRLLISVSLIAPALAQNPTAELLTELLRVDNSNPPGNEGQLAQLLAQKFKALGIDVEIIPTPDPKKAHFLARLKGDGSKRPVLIAAHADTVGVEREKWTLDPFAGMVRDGYVYGRGAIDFKGGLAVFAQAVIQLHQNHIPLARDVILLSEADEEGGPYNTTWLAQNHWPKIDCEFALNEGGWIIANPDMRVRYVSISTADKTAVSLKLTARGTSTHSSMPRPDNAIFTLSRALARLADYDTKPKLIPITEEFFDTLARTSTPPLSDHLRNLVHATDPRVRDEAARQVSQDPLLHAIMRNTIAPVLLNAGFRSNVIPGSAEATINFRIVPGTELEDLIREIRGVIADPAVEVAPVSAGPARSAQISSQDTELYRALVEQATAVFAGAPVTPYLFQAGTDASAWRSRGVPVYGIYPYPITAEDLTRMHGNDERVPVASLHVGTEMIYRTLVAVAGKR